MSNIEKGKLLQTFDSWGPEFEIEFNIIVNDFNFDYWANVFQFTTRNYNRGCDVTTYKDNLGDTTLPNGRTTWTCCTEDNPCDVGEGDCEGEGKNECMPGLSCGENNCPSGFPSELDCCTNGVNSAFDFGVSVNGNTDSIRISTEDNYYVTNIPTGESINIVIKQYFVAGSSSNCNDLCSIGTQWTPDRVFCPGEFYYDVIIDDNVVVHEINTSPQTFSNVKFYGSGPQYNAFNSNLGEVDLLFVKSTDTGDYCQYTESGCDLDTYLEAGCTGEEHPFKKIIGPISTVTRTHPCSRKCLF